LFILGTIHNAARNYNLWTRVAAHLFPSSSSSEASSLPDLTSSFTEAAFAAGIPLREDLDDELEEGLGPLPAGVTKAGGARAATRGAGALQQEERPQRQGLPVR